MIRETFALLGAMYDALGPGFLLAVALPFMVVGLALVLRRLSRQLKH